MLALIKKVKYMALATRNIKDFQDLGLQLTNPFQQLGRKRPRLFPDLDFAEAVPSSRGRRPKGSYTAPLWKPQRAASGASPRDFRFK